MKNGRAGERIGRAQAAGVVGREAELTRLVRQLDPGGAAVMHVSGPGGIGKTALLDAAVSRLAAAGAMVLRLDGRVVEPTPRGFLAAAAATLGGEAEAVADLAELLDGLPTLVFVVDEIDHLWLLDAWLRDELLPAMPDDVRWILAGRFAPVQAWAGEAFVGLRLGPLAADAGHTLLSRRGVAEEDVPAVLRLARGNPLALALTAGPPLSDDLDGLDDAAVLEVLVRRYVEDLPAELGELLDAACVLRRVGRPVLASVLGRKLDDGALGGLAALPFVEPSEHGLIVHELVRQAVSSRLEVLDPARHHALRRAAFAALEVQLDGALSAGPDAWRLTADLLFALERGAIRDAVFPDHERTVTIARARGDAPGLLELLRHHGYRDAGSRHADEGAMLLELGDGLWSWLRELVRASLAPR